MVTRGEPLTPTHYHGNAGFNRGEMTSPERTHLSSQARQRRIVLREKIARVRIDARTTHIIQVFAGKTKI